MPETAEKTKDTSGIRSLHIPADLREELKAAARSRGLSVSAVARLAIADYLAGKLSIPTDPGTKIVYTTMWVPDNVWTKFLRKLEKKGDSTPKVLRAWLDQGGPAE